MNLRGALAVVLVLFVAATPPPALADDVPTGDVPECSLPTRPPEGSARLRWRSSIDGEGATGTWVSDPALLRAAARTNACRAGWEKCELDLTVERGKKMTIGWKAWAIGIGAGIAVGFAAGAMLK